MKERATHRDRKRQGGRKIETETGGGIEKDKKRNGVGERETGVGYNLASNWLKFGCNQFVSGFSKSASNSNVNC